ncbi:(Glutamate--ammonia-ligase) adenylyltransferase [Thermocrinis albus DSM 14484]|uniref:(Glutamate--ammonia-ligase) adenylyltransferase n=1 Tax=Thermocrinis albus (strain DSM 14484 / JCM 11386 / HI 11/12) TaxID=638303 RepID=D3SNM5_THEAH|nr:glutamine-synthetase adenylyltransferase [Thermocrinis albus]ADC88762.1 (Glutamate--ammonia-ligase) adenylyltransferase [Thermocrinis albus DSM 14484]
MWNEKLERWWLQNYNQFFNPQRVKESLQELLQKHPHPQSLMDYLNERRFYLLGKLMDMSECVRKFLLNHPQEFEKTIPGLWYVFKDRETYRKELSGMVHDSMSDEEFSQRLAYYRHRELMRILSKEILGTAPLQDILSEYSQLPDAMLQLCYERALSQMTEKYGVPTEEGGKRATGVILALGKLGSYELNYYSDIDVMFLHSSDRGNAGKLSLQEFFSMVFQKVVSLMNSTTQEGKPYEVDLNLRPFGRSGPITMSVRSAELYYESYGRTWERFALLRARFCAGDEELWKIFDRDVRTPFVFGRTTDYRIIEEIRLIKSQLQAEASKRLIGKQNVKTGKGGIRELEFAVQSLILLLGGKNPFLRESNTFRAIWLLHEKGVFSTEEALQLERAYTFLRSLEHRIQLRNCSQTQSFGEGDLTFLAVSMGLRREQLEGLYRQYTNVVREVFEGLVPSEKVEELHPLSAVLLSGDLQELQHFLEGMGFRQTQRTGSVLMSYLHGKEGIRLSTQEKNRLLKVLPRYVECLSSSADPDESIINFDKLFTNPTGRKIILSDPREDIVPSLCRILSLSSYLSGILARNPDLLEDVLTLYQQYPSSHHIETELRKYKEILNLSYENLLRRFRTVWEVRIALVYLMKEKGYEDLLEFFESLSTLADVILGDLWEHLGLSGEKVLLLALGKYGSKELTVGSDLDLVFVAEHSQEEIVRKAQKVVKLLTLHTPEGYLYKVDFRLRPMGTKGDLVPPIAFYREYFERDARTWERIAWTRCRYITGDTDLKEQMEELLHRFLFEKPLGEREREEIKQMRFKLEASAKKGKGMWDIKLGPGGIMDGDFILQYYLLKEKKRESSMIRALKELSTRIPLLAQIYPHYLFLRKVETHLRLSRESATSVLQTQDIQKVAGSMNMSPQDLEEKITEATGRLREAFLEVFD